MRPFRNKNRRSVGSFQWQTFVQDYERLSESGYVLVNIIEIVADVMRVPGERVVSDSPTVSLCKTAAAM